MRNNATQFLGKPYAIVSREQFHIPSNFVQNCDTISACPLEHYPILASLSLLRHRHKHL